MTATSRTVLEMAHDGTTTVMMEEETATGIAMMTGTAGNAMTTGTVETTTEEVKISLFFTASFFTFPFESLVNMT